MKVTIERLPKSIVAVDVELDQQQVTKGLERAARKLSQQFRIPGFRPGKAPRQIVESYLGRDRLLEEATDDLIQKSFTDALKQEQVVPVGRPQLENVEQEPFRYRVNVPVEPIVELPPYTGYGLQLNVDEVGDEQVQKLLDAQREQHVVLQELDEPRPAQLGDQVTVSITSDLDEDEDDEIEGELEEDDQIELSGDDDDESEALDAENDEIELLGDDEDTAVLNAELEADIAADADEDELADEELADEAAELDLLDADHEDEDADELDADDELEAAAATGQEQQIALVEGRTRPEVLEALVGAQPGETRSVSITYGDDEENEALRGRTVNYNMTVNNVQARQLPDWEELPTLSEFPGDFDALRANARQRLERAAETKARQEVTNAFMERLESETELDMPDAMIDDRATELFHAQVEQITRQFGIGEEQYLQAIGKTHEEAASEFREQAERDVRRQVILRALVERENIQLGNDEVAQERERLLEDFDAARRDDMAKLLDTPQMQQSLRSSALDRKLNDRLVALATGQAATTDDPALPTAMEVDVPATAPAADRDTVVVQTAEDDAALAQSESDQATQNR